jgi:hypothetical protein
MNTTIKAETRFSVTTIDSKEIANCNALALHNRGDVSALINGSYPLLPGDYLILDNEPGIMDVSQYEITFDKQTKGIDPQVHIIRTTHKRITANDVERYTATK